MLEWTSGDCLAQPSSSMQCQLEQAAEDFVQLGFEYLQGEVTMLKFRIYVCLIYDRCIAVRA